jgi:fatty acid amide hydrolase 2
MGPMTRFACDLKPSLKAMAADGISNLPKLDDPVDFSKVTIYYMVDDLDPVKTRVCPEIKSSILKITRHFEQTYKTEVKPVLFTEFKKTVVMLMTSFKASGGKPMAQLLSDNQDQEISLFRELFKSIARKSDYTLHAIAYALLEKVVPKVDSNFVQSSLKLRDQLIEEITELLGDSGVLLMPSQPEGAPKHGTTLLKSSNMAHATILNLLGLPATHIPTGLDSNQMPVGVQVAANPYNDHLTLAVAEECEKSLDMKWIPPFHDKSQ